jgi:hypothetical protein
LVADRIRSVTMRSMAVLDGENMTEPQSGFVSAHT